MIVHNFNSVGVGEVHAKAYGVVIPPGGITPEYAEELRNQRKERLANGEVEMANAIARSLETRGWAVE